MGGGASTTAAAEGDAAARSPATLQWQDATKLFNEIDASKDGIISTEELTAVLQAHGYTDKVAATLLHEMDTNQDGLVSFDEWRRGFYSSSFCSVKQPASEDFGDLLPSEAAGCVIKETAERSITVEQRAQELVLILRPTRVAARLLTQRGRMIESYLRSRARPASHPASVHRRGLAQLGRQAARAKAGLAVRGRAVCDQAGDVREAGHLR